MNLSHYSAEPFEVDYERVYDQGGPRGGYGKPRGLWLSVDGEHGWPEWCRAEDWGLERLTHRKCFRLVPEANVLVLSSLSKLIAFDAKYAIPHEYRPLSELDWASTIEQYDGIIIAPYQWQARMELGWYNGWDCASGCIWDLSALMEVNADEMAVES